MEASGEDREILQEGRLYHMFLKNNFNSLVLRSGFILSHLTPSQDAVFLLRNTVGSCPVLFVPRAQGPFQLVCCKVRQPQLGFFYEFSRGKMQSTSLVAFEVSQANSKDVSVYL